MLEALVIVPKLYLCEILTKVEILHLKKGKKGNMKIYETHH